MRPLFGGPGCTVNEAGISTAGNPLSRMLDGVTNDPMLARQMREGAMSSMGPRGPMPGGALGPRGHLLNPMMSRGGSMEDAWQEVGPMPRGPMMGAAMQDQFMRHMQGPRGPGMSEPNFFTAGPMGPAGDDWAAEFSAGPAGAPGILRPPMGAGWAAEFARAPMPDPMEAAFHQAQMEAAFAQSQAMRPPNPMEAAFMEASMRQEQANMEAAFAQLPQVSAQPSMAAAWDAAEPSMAAAWDKAEPSSMAAAWDAAEPSMAAAWDAAEPSAVEEAEQKLADLKAAEAMEAMWQGAAEAEALRMEQAWNGDDAHLEDVWDRAGDEYKFSEDNPYAASADPLAEAQRLLAEGRDKEALLALEAEVQKNPESSEGWRQLGQLYAALDQDVEAIRCLRRGHAVDPYNLESILALGVSLTNELDRLPALKYLRRWVENHEEYSALADGLETPAPYEYEKWRSQVSSLFSQAAAANPLDADVFVALGVMENINMNYEAAVQALATACRLRPNDYTNWNKLGATLANSGSSERAVVAYHQALQLKPNYSRGWSNLAVAHANLGQNEDATRFYLSSLVLNPDATHIWDNIKTSVLNSPNSDMNLFKGVQMKDMQTCAGIVEGVLQPAELPKPQEELSQPPDEILSSLGL
mmetsp:Transcript_32260/g.55947  ORF Transcript_32260/g.55947 Transcript_32260/m.55947 type:complete len:640 (+) Transcript_32260:122-2041(+)